MTNELSLSELPDIGINPSFRVTVVHAKKHIPDVLVLTLSRPKEFVFVPGQYLWLVLPERSKKNGVVDRRAFSLTSCANTRYIELLIRKVDTDYHAALFALEKGDGVDVIGPFGSAFSSYEKGAIMIAGGTGIAPFVSILRSPVADQRFSLLHYSREKEPLYCVRELRAGVRKKKFHLALREGMPTQQDIVHIVRAGDTRAIFISGPQGFVDAVSNLLRAEHIKPDCLRYEALYPTDPFAEKLRSLFSDMRMAAPARSDAGDIPELGDLFLQVIRQTSNHVMLTDGNGKIVYANQAAERITGYTLAELKGQTPRVWGGLMPPAVYSEFWTALKKGESVEKTVLNRRRNGQLYVAIFTLTPIVIHGGIVCFIATEEDITELKKVDQTKSEFITLASHQLRTPISIIQWYAELFLSGDFGKITSGQREALEEIKHGGKRMEHLVNALLTVSMVELGVSKKEKMPIDIRKLLRDVVQSEKTRIMDKRIVVSFRIPKHLSPVISDPKFLRIILDNLLSNAIQYTPRGGRISISASFKAKTKETIFRISDTGIGIPKDQQDRVFKKFFRAENAKKVYTGGTGLGLYLVKSIVEQLDGSISFVSQEGKGTAFIVALPAD
ncbi:MAG: ATP-binding protein [Patescibacteria group bacterium]